MRSIRDTLDPNQTLPNVWLDIAKSHDFGHMTRDQINIMENDDRVGHCDIVAEREPVPFAHFDGIEIHDEKNRGRGIGLATYILAIEFAHSHGFDFETQNWELTTHAKKVWEHLAAKSVAEIVQPFEPSPRVEGKFIGKYRVAVPEKRELVKPDVNVGIL